MRRPTDVVLTAYEKAVLLELQAWKSPPRTWRSRAGDRVDGALDGLAGLLPTGFLAAVVTRALPMLNEAARITVPEDLVVAAYRRAGFEQVHRPGDVAQLGLADADRVTGDRRMREALKGAAEGAGLGWLGLPAVPADVAALTVLALRTVNHHALLYGFDVSAPAERAYALQILDASTALGRNAKTVSRAAVSGLGRGIAGRETGLGISRLLARLPERVVARATVLSSPKAAPVVGALTGGSFNAWYLRGVAGTARLAYRERFLLRRHGPDVLQAFGL